MWRLELVGSLGDVRYHYRRGGRLISKRVRFFLFHFSWLAESLRPGDGGRALAPDGGGRPQLTYPGEREMVQSALSKTGADR